ARLPGELASLVFDDLDLDHIVHASHVSRKWRVRAQTHPTFYSDITVHSRHYTGPPEAVCAFFQARVSAAGTKTIAQLSIRVTGPCAAVQRVFLPAVAQCLPRIVRLVLIFKDCYASQVYDALSGPAPRLRSLVLHLLNIYDGDPVAQDDMTCPEDIFSRHAPQLRELSLLGTMWPQVPVPAFSCVASIRTEYDDATIPNPEVLFISCPAFDDLVFNSDSVDDIPQDLWDVCHNRRLRRLVIDGPSQTSAVLNVTTADTEHVNFYGTWADAATFNHVFQHMAAEVQMQLLSDRDVLRVVLKDDFRTRQVDYLVVEIEEWLTPSIFSPMLSRITTLSVDTESLFDLPRIALRFPSVVTLVIAWSCPEESGSLFQPLSFPALRRLEVEGSPEWGETSEVRVLDLAQFMGHVLGCLPRKALALVFRNGAHLEGDPQGVRGYFKEIIIL
ncbi:hypothetical protein EXIGLDRAFT_731417, partial [Exidia glandulosa HHB12029]